MNSTTMPNTLPENFPAAFVINLSERIDRRQRGFEEEPGPLWGCNSNFPGSGICWSSWVPNRW